MMFADWNYSPPVCKVRAKCHCSTFCINVLTSQGQHFVDSRTRSIKKQQHRIERLRTECTRISRRSFEGSVVKQIYVRYERPGGSRLSWDRHWPFAQLAPRQPLFKKCC